MRSRGGAVLKTMGDAVLAVFGSPRDGFLAARDMVAAARDELGGHGIGLKVGLHDGPCLVVRSGGRVDLFGMTVNTAARLQQRASPGQICASAELFEHGDLAPYASTATRVEAVLKGVPDPRVFLAVDA